MLIRRSMLLAFLLIINVVTSSHPATSEWTDWEEQNKRQESADEDIALERQLPQQQRAFGPPEQQLQQSELRIGAFNLHQFGRTRWKNTPVIECLAKVLAGYDVIFLNEIWGKSSEPITAMFAKVKSQSGEDWGMKLSNPLGKSNSKEQYAFFYKTKRVEVIAVHQWNDASTFERPPFIIKIKPVNGTFQFGFIGVHVRPDSAPAEISALADVYNGMKTYWGIEDFIIGGDLNAAPGYVKAHDWNRIKLWTEKGFRWIIDEGSMTNGNGRAYDRFVLAGAMLKSAYVGRSAKVHKYEKEIGTACTDNLVQLQHLSLLA